MSQETQNDFILGLLKHSNWEPDFEAVAQEWQLAGTSYIKSRLRSIVEGRGYSLEGDAKVTEGEGLLAVAESIPKSAKAKKRKNTNDNGDDAQESNGKKQKKVQNDGAMKVKRAKKGKSTTSKTTAQGVVAAQQLVPEGTAEDSEARLAGEAVSGKKVTRGESNAQLRDNASEDEV